MKNTGKKRLTLFDTCAVAIGGMIGGGTFAVIGEAVLVQGNATFISFGIAGILALITGASYVRLTLSFDAPGGSFLFVEKFLGTLVAAILRLLLIVGYVFAMSLYTYILGAYICNLIGLDKSMYHYIGAIATALLTLLNLADVHKNATIRDVFVYGRIATIIFIIGTGLFSIKRQMLFPVSEYSLFNMIDAAAMVFISYEGFQFLTYSYKDIGNRNHNFPRAMAVSIGTVILIYMLIALVTAGSLTKQVIANNRETVLVNVAQVALGQTWVKFAVSTIVITIASALFTTIYTTAGLTKPIMNYFSTVNLRERAVLPMVPIILVSACAIIIQIVLTLHQIIVFSSSIFLVIFAVVNLSAYLHLKNRIWQSALPFIGIVGCVSATAVLVFYHLFYHFPD